MVLGECETRIHLGEEVSRAIGLVYGLLDQRKEQGKSSELAIHIVEARIAERVAVKAFEDHCKAHGCKTQPA